MTTPQRDESFNAYNLDRALNDLAEWSKLGVQLNIPLDKLKRIKCENYGVNDCKLALIHLLLDNYQLSWDDICCALERIDQTNLAHKIRQEFIEKEHATSMPAYQPCKGTCKVKIRRFLRQRLFLLLVVFALLLVFVILYTTRVTYPRCSRDHSTTILTRIIGEEKLSTVKFMIESMGIDPQTCIDFAGKSSLNAAVRADNMEVIEYLIDSWNWVVTCSDNWSEMHEACYLGKLEIVSYFFAKNYTDCGTSLMRAAAIGGQLTIIDYLQSKGYKITCDGKWSTLHEASYFGQKCIIEYYSEKMKDICSCVDESGNTLLHAAAVPKERDSDGQLAVIKFLVEVQGCAKTARNMYGEAPLDVARRQQNTAAIKYLE